ncbi:hypothetical protein Tco_0936431, partial [Tanacetum coccineum]
TDVEAPPNIIDVNEDDDFIDDEDGVPYDLAHSDDEVFANDDDDDVAVMSAAVARGYSGGDDPSCPLPRPLHTGCQGVGGRKANRGGRGASRLATHGETRNLGLKKIGNPMYYPSWHKIEEEKKAGVLGKLMDPTRHVMWQPSDPNLPRRSSRQSGIRRLTIGLTLSTLPEPFKMLKIRQRARSSVGRDPDHLLSSEICRWRAPRLEKEMIRLRDLGANTPTGVPYTEDKIMAMVRKGKHRWHIPGVGRVFAGQGRDAISINEPRGAYTDADVDEIKEDNKRLRKELTMLRTVVTSDDRMSRLLT